MPATANSFMSPQVPKTASVPLLPTANTNLAVPVTTTLLLAAGAAGARLTRLEALATATQTATQIQVYRADAGGANKRLIRAKNFPLYTLSTSSEIPPLDLGYSDVSPLILGPGEEIYVASGVAVTGINARAEWGDF